jgi:hypothetical protein
MKETTQKILESGLVDETVILMLEKLGTLPDGASEIAKKATLKEATRDQLMKFGEELGEAIDKERRLRETMLDLNQLRWPTEVHIFSHGREVARHVVCIIDRMGRFYFRHQDVKKEWFVPGYQMRRTENDTMRMETILEVSELYTGDQVAAIQVSTKT